MPAWGSLSLLPQNLGLSGQAARVAGNGGCRPVEPSIGDDARAKNLSRYGTKGHQNDTKFFCRAFAVAFVRDVVVSLQIALHLEGVECRPR